MQQTKKAQYRQRVYQLADGSIALIFGADDAPAPDAKLLADHDVTEVVTVVDHVAAETPQPILPLDPTPVP